MGASTSTRRIIVEEDDKQGFLVQISDSVTKQIYGVKEPGGKALKKYVDPIHKAVEAAPSVKPALPIQTFPTIPLVPASPPVASPKRVAAADAAAPEPVGKAEEKPATADTTTSKAETKVKKPEDHGAPETATITESPKEGAQEEKKPVEVPPEPSVGAETTTAAAADEVSAEQAPVPPPKIPRSAILQLFIPSPAPPKEPEAPVSKEAPSEKEVVTVSKQDVPAATTLSPSEKALYEERELLYKQMGEVYRERDKALKSIEDFYREKMNALQNQSSKMHSATRQEFSKAVEEVEKKFLKHVEAPVCEDLQLKVLDCYRKNKAHPLNCSNEVQAFSLAVDQARQNVILAKKG